MPSSPAPDSNLIGMGYDLYVSTERAVHNLS